MEFGKIELAMIEHGLLVLDNEYCRLKEKRSPNYGVRPTIDDMLLDLDLEKIAGRIADLEYLKEEILGNIEP